MVVGEKEGISLAYAASISEKILNESGFNMLENMRNELVDGQGRNVTLTEEGNLIKVRYNETGHEYMVDGKTGVIKDLGSTEPGTPEVPDEPDEPEVINWEYERTERKLWSGCKIYR